ncbi:helix-turn-helix domain-containing protein [Streptomyces krungchingensis]
MSLVVTTEDVPDGERRDYWHNVVMETFVPLNVAITQDGSFSGNITTDHLSYLQVSTVEADAEHVTRTESLISRAVEEYLLVGLQDAGPGVVSQDGRQAQLGPGDIALYDTTRPYTLDFQEHFRMKVFQLPKRLLAVTQDDLRLVTGTTIRSDEGVGALLSPFLSALSDKAADYHPAAGERLAGNVADLLATLVSERLGKEADRDTIRGTHALRIKLYINQRLADPELTPELIANAHHISVRYLHKIFEEEGLTVSRWIQRRRLEECRRELRRRAATNPTVGAIAHRWGFTSVAHFSRAFRATYGMSPSEWRAGQGSEPA